jgi:hypothetical protein
MNTQMRLFDGYTIETEKGRIGTFDIDPDEVGFYRADEVLVLVVTATVAGESTRQTTGGDWLRTNNLKAHIVHVAQGLMRDELIEFYNLTGDELPFPTTPAAPAAPQSVTTPVESSEVADQLAEAVAAAEQDLPPEAEEEDLPAAANDNNQIVGTHDPALIGFLTEV